MWGNDKEEYMDTSDTPWCWYYLADCGRWHRFEDDPDNALCSEDIEKYYLRNSKAVLSSSSCHSKIDFSVMLQTDLITGRHRRIHRGYNIERSCSCFSASLVFWEKVDPTCPYQLIPLSELTPEYQTVAGYVKEDGLLDRSIVSISRIQNLDLWEIYCRKKKQLMRIQGVKEIQERRLFHGTEIRNIDNICKYNFDLRLAGQHGHVLGKGIYFAKYATYADKYSKSSTDPLPFYGRETQRVHSECTKIIFLARVMIGKSNVGKKHFQKPDHGSSEDSHHSCVDDINNPTIFVIFDPNQIYPEYLIQYR
ncbi:protein mono-ADP-ribosyltransferase PARP11 [Siniperca chuatsi]|uniref:protein mono-ADP-ribosyltransferase PARP11 n=1 Tax=Siniperca chuatsi TaxID=119488 RepID=UPI001CE10C3A|nr:protein mono-ADP-ribosyltransferase PARP11 [Siniperca chuatsi]XP_044041794.1 protein mono-ADP-ribosyltransferase PARP11 [Siniperca chuatsi]